VAFITDNAPNSLLFVWTADPAVRLTSGYVSTPHLTSWLALCSQSGRERCVHRLYTVRVGSKADPSVFADSAAIAIDGCSFAPCANGGACSASDSTCACAAGYTGAGCQTDLCAGLNCNSGSCSRALSAAAGRGVCSCPSGFIGTYCEVPTSSGCTLTCGNGGAVNGACSGCTCPAASNWQGTTCNTCALSCLNGGTANAACDSCVCPTVRLRSYICLDFSARCDLSCACALVLRV
jgi:hypothetical protein